MADCCQNEGCEVAALRAEHARALWIVLAINATMFLIEGTAGIIAHSTSLLADALDMFGYAADALKLALRAHTAKAMP
jgi:Co/Zn/Cd efflux system component